MVRDLGFVRSDGRTLIAQPHLREEGRWTLDDLAAVAMKVESPNINTAKTMGLPSGDWHAPFAAGGNALNGSRNGNSAAILETAGN